MISVKRSLRATARRLWPALVLALIPTSTGIAAILDCAAQPSTWDDAWGAVPIGGDIKAAERAGLVKPCTNAGQCKYRDETGVGYGVDDANAVLYKDFEVESVAGGKLPLGLMRNDTLVEALRKLRSERGLEVVVVAIGDIYMLQSGLCFANGGGAPFSIMIAFHPDGRLMAGGLYSKEMTEENRSIIDWVREHSTKY